MKRYLILFAISISFLTTNAQWVNIPDSNFGKWLATNYPTCMQGNPQTGFQMDTTCSAIVNETTVDCSSQQIIDVSAIKFFDGLTWFNCYGNFITSFPQLPIGLTRLDCFYNQLSALPSLPAGLTYLNCTQNQLSALPSLPASLTRLYCAENQLSTLPPLNVSLIELICTMNQLSTIPSLPAGLTLLACGSNQLTTLPSLPAGLKQMNCDKNQLSTLPSLPAGLKQMNCSFNQLSTLPSLPASLTFLDCDYNQLTILPALPLSIDILWCSYNQLTTLPNLPPSLTQLSCYKNQLVALPSLPAGLTQLACNYNQLSTLPSLPAGLTQLNCSNNQLTSLPALPDSLYSFSCIFNPNLYCLPRLNKVVDFRFNSTGITCLPNYPDGNTFSLPDLSTIPLCDLVSGCPVYWNITGNVHEDTSTTCNQDSLYPGNRLHGLKAQLSEAGVLQEQMYLTPAGEYSFDTRSFSNYEVTIDTTGMPIQFKCPVSGTQQVAVTALDSLKYNVNFGLECKGYDVGVRSLLGRFRAAQYSLVLIEAGDIGIGCTGNSSAIVTTTITGAAHYISPGIGALTPTSVVGDTITYAIADVSTINEATDFNIVVQTDSNAVLGSSVCITTTIHTPTPDYNPANDSLTMCFTVVNSFDPNDKTVYPKDISQNATWLNYTIQFQNTGNDTAYDIVVRDTLSANLDLESFQYLASSHSPIVQVKGNVVIFTFANINLLDSFHNEPKSHGWLQYRIKTKPGLPLQSQIKNKAYIYFDLNAPVVTNTTVNTVNVTGINDINGVEPSLALYPNPASSVLHIGTNAMHPQWLTFYDASGRKVSEQAYTNTIDVSALASGVYLLELKSSEGIVRRRFVR